MSLYQVIEIIEVQENPNAQYSSKWAITKMHKTETFIEVSSDPKVLCKKLKELKFIDSCDMRKVSVSSTDKDLIEVRNKKDLKPLCRLEVAKWIIH